MEKFAMYGKLIAHPGKRDELAEILLEAAAMLSDNKDCELYIVNVSDSDPNAVWVTELWSSQDAHAASLQGADTSGLLQRGRPLIAGAEPLKLKPLGGKGF
ncbi:antibiotic biosynthesis monooxygenase [Paenibacillus sp. ISL-20]|uniref:putative quinol monooxygenase n=1 Tax=Paenibacillus sp. ISL-20 TaxID=2819163 RepID=UPI001BE7F234|nr:antibiotic biosynthesis monooxygenase [Paenibacillus sp. ISL-20]MBT2762362.1 antibiotic biosynthesis monooxygenase [Paenibacillus sp. ISL-20]